MRVIRFHYERRYHKRGLLIDCRWFLLRVYPPVLPRWTFWRRKLCKPSSTRTAAR